MKPGYINLGTASIIFQVAIAGLFGIAFALKLYWRNIKAFFSKNKDEELAEIAREKAENKFGLREHLIAYLVVNFFIFIAWLLVFLINRNAWYPWFLVPLVVWGIILLIYSRSLRRGEAVG